MNRARRFVRVIQHEAVEGPALIAEALAREGVEVEITRVDQGAPVPAGLDGAEGLVVLGGSAGVYEADQLPHLRDEIRLIESAVRAGRPVLGVCLGSQLVAAALGARVYQGSYQEIGWFPVTPKAAAADDALFSPIGESFVCLHWHGDLFDLPGGAVSLASSERTPHQAYRHGDRTYGLLFHLEVTPEVVRGMVETCAGELDHAGVSGQSLIEGAGRWGDQAAAVAVPLFQRWAALLSG